MRILQILFILLSSELFAYKIIAPAPGSIVTGRNNNQRGHPIYLYCYNN